MAGSGFRPSPNIPYCCLPQESGPCLSASVGDRPLRSPSHHGLGGPSPRRLSNGTHARPRPPELSPPGDAPEWPHGALPGVSTGCAPVGGWLHTRCAPVRHSRRPEGRLPFDLHVLGLPLAFILSQDQTLRCSIAVLLNYSESRVPLHPALTRGKVLPCFLLSRYAHNGLRPCAGLRLSMNSALPQTSLSPRLVPRESGCKSTAFFITRNSFFRFFETFLYYTDYQHIKTVNFYK